MTVLQAILKCDKLKPNQYDSGDKTQWLSNLDLMVSNNILKAHEDNTHADFIGYPESGSDDTVLLVPDPYSEVYIFYLFAQIDFNNAEYTRYNNSMIMFNEAYATYARYYNRTHLPINNGNIKIDF